MRATKMLDGTLKNFVLADFACFIQATDLEMIGKIILHALTLFLFPIRNAAVTRSWEFLAKVISETDSERERDSMLHEMEEMERNVRETAILLQESDPDYEANVIRSCWMQIAQFQPDYIASNSELGLIEGSPFYAKLLPAHS